MGALTYSINSLTQGSVTMTSELDYLSSLVKDSDKQQEDRVRETTYAVPYLQPRKHNPADAVQTINHVVRLSDKHRRYAEFALLIQTMRPEEVETLLNQEEVAAVNEANTYLEHFATDNSQRAIARRQRIAEWRENLVECMLHEGSLCGGNEMVPVELIARLEHTTDYPSVQWLDSLRQEADILDSSDQYSLIIPAKKFWGASARGRPTLTRSPEEKSQSQTYAPYRPQEPVAEVLERIPAKFKHETVLDETWLNVAKEVDPKRKGDIFEDETYQEMVKGIPPEVIRQAEDQVRRERERRRAGRLKRQGALKESSRSVSPQPWPKNGVDDWLNHYTILKSEDDDGREVAR